VTHYDEALIAYGHSFPLWHPGLYYVNVKKISSDINLGLKLGLGEGLRLEIRLTLPLD